MAKIGGDVSYICTEILPALVPGVHVHFHDVFYAFEYPARVGLRWTGLVGGLRTARCSLLQPGLRHRPVQYLFHRETFASEFPLCLRNTGGSIWIRRESASVP